MVDIIQFPEPSSPPSLLVGPFERYDVIVEGRKIPLLQGLPRANGDIALIVDGRFMADFSEPVARQVSWLVANAIAVAQGYSHLAAETKQMPFAPQVSEITLEPSP